MLTTEVILGLATSFNPEAKEGYNHLKHGILAVEHGMWPIGTPLIIGELPEENCKVNARALMYSHRECDGHDLRIRTYSKLLRPVNLKPLVPRHKVITPVQFLPEKWRRLVEYVHDMGSISFCVTAKSSLRRFVVDDLKWIAGHFKYNTVTSRRGYSGKYLSSEEDIVLGVITFIDIVYGIPIFDTKKVDGIGLSFSLVTKEASETYGSLHKVYSIDMLFSNYRENIFIIDGSWVGNNFPLNDDLIREMYDRVDMELPVHKTKAKSHTKTLKDDKIKFGVASFEAEPSEPSLWEIDSSDTQIDFSEFSDLIDEEVPGPSDEEVELSDEIVEPSGEVEPANNLFFDSNVNTVDVSSMGTEMVFDDGVNTYINVINTSNTSQNEEE